MGVWVWMDGLALLMWPIVTAIVSFFTINLHVLVKLSYAQLSSDDFTFMGKSEARETPV